MPPPAHVNLGPRARAILSRAVWRDESAFPAGQTWADDFERILAFIDASGQWNRLFPRLTAREWMGALAEARFGFYFHRNGFRILSWEPEIVKDRPGDFEMQWADCEPIFVEVKMPGWGGELAPEELKANRQHQPKYQNSDARFVDPIGKAQRAIDKALPKLSPTKCNLVAIVDDLFFSPIDSPFGCLPDRIVRHLANDVGRVVGGVYFLDPVVWGGLTAVEYRKYFVPNPNAIRPLPRPVLQGFIQGNSDLQGPPWDRRRLSSST